MDEELEGRIMQVINCLTSKAVKRMDADQETAVRSMIKAKSYDPGFLKCAAIEAASCTLALQEAGMEDATQIFTNALLVSAGLNPMYQRKDISYPDSKANGSLKNY